MTSIVLVHGITESKAAWDPLIAALAVDPASGERRRVLAADLRGHGASTRNPPFDLATMAADVMAELAEGGIDPADAVIIGHSLGGTVVTAMASAAAFQGVINVDQPLRLADFKAGLTQLEPMLRGEVSAFQQAITMVFDSMRGPLPDDEFARIAALRKPEQAVVLGVWEPVLEMSAEELDAMVAGMLPAITSPYLSLHGIDPGPDYPEWLTAHLATASVELWTDHGHYPHLVAPTRFVDRVNDFLVEITG